MSIFNRICEMEGYECRDFAVPAPGVEMASQVLDITRRMRADWVVGTSSVMRHPSIKELKKTAFHLTRYSAWCGGLARKT